MHILHPYLWETALPLPKVSSVSKSASRRSVTFEFCLTPKNMLRVKHSQLLQVQVGKVPSTNSIQQLPHG